MRVAVLGAGTAGFVAAAQFSKALPQAELLHVFDSQLPTIGVGEGTTPRFPGWFEDVTGLSFETLAERCGATLKTGTQFEGWGSAGRTFINRFQPVRLVGYHFDAASVVQVLAEHVRAERVDARVTALLRQPDGVRLQLQGGQNMLCDYVFDCRGFPRSTNAGQGAEDEVLALDWIPTGRAMLRRIAPGGFSGVTRAIARPHGWIFQIPLRDWTSTGYIYNPGLSSDAEVDADYTRFLHEAGVAHWEPRGALAFPNFVRKQLFDGRVFRGGNAACFLEPLEATAIGSAIVLARAAGHWMAEHATKAGAEAEVADYNQALLTNVCRDSLFLAWHYSGGSCWDTPFWRHARQGLDRARATPWAAAQLDAMKPFVAAGRRLPGPELAACGSQDEWDQRILPLLKLFRPYGNFSELNFAQVGHGIGCYETRPGGAHPRRIRQVRVARGS